jgi:hypothetical protein
MATPPVALSPLQETSWPIPTPPASARGDLSLPSDSTSTSKKNREFLALALDRFKICAETESNRRDEMLMDLRFRCGEQWDSDIRARRERGDIARPCLTINRIPGFTKHVVNQMRQQRPAIKVDAVGDGADELQASVRQGLIRHIEINSNADIAYDTAFDNMCVMGLGWMRVVNDWSAPDSFDQDLFVRWVPNTFHVYSDPDAAQPDWSDMRYAFVIEDISRDEFKARFGEEFEAADLSNFQSIGDHQKYWFPNGKVRIAEYFHIEQEKDKLLKLTDGKKYYWSELKAEGAEFDEFGDVVGLPDGLHVMLDEDAKPVMRDCLRPQVYWNLISAVDILKERKWEGRFIPLIPVIGNQIDLDGERLIVGMVRYAREPQRLYNYMYSSFVETVALAPRNQFIAEVDQVGEFRESWLKANVDPQAVLFYKAKVVEGGGLLPPPIRQSATVDLAAFVQGLQMADQQLKAVFNIFDASLGQRGPQESGLAINARKIESDTGTYDWGDNFIRSLRHLGIVLNDLLEYYYNTPGRQQQIVREDKTQETVTMNQSYQNKQGATVFYDLSKGKFGVVISTGPSILERRQETKAGMLELFKAAPETMSVAADLFVDSMDFEGKEAIAARLKKALPPALQDPDPNAPPIPPQFLQQMQQAMQQIQGLTAALHEATDKNAMTRFKEEINLLRTEMTNRSNEIIEMMKAGAAQGQFLAEKDFDEAERLRKVVEDQIEQAQPSSTAPAPGAQPAPQPAAPQTTLAVPQTAGGQLPGAL